MAYKKPELLTEDDIELICELLSKTKKAFLCRDEAWYNKYNTYATIAFQQNETGELVEHLNDLWISDLDYRHGRDTVLGMFGQYVAHLCYLQNGYSVTPLMSEEHQRQEMDLMVEDNTTHKVEYVSVKNNHERVYENSKPMIRFGSDYFEKAGPAVTRLIFPDIYRWRCREFDYTVAYQFFDNNKKLDRDHGWFMKTIPNLPKHRTYKVLY